MILHRDESRPAASFGDTERARHLPGVAGAGADVANFPLVDEVVERGERLVYRYRGFEAMDLVEVNRFDAEPSQTRLTRLDDVLA